MHPNGRWTHTVLQVYTLKQSPGFRGLTKKKKIQTTRLHLTHFTLQVFSTTCRLQNAHRKKNVHEYFLFTGSLSGLWPCGLPVCPVKVYPFSPADTPNSSVRTAGTKAFTESSDERPVTNLHGEHYRGPWRKNTT